MGKYFKPKASRVPSILGRLNEVSKGKVVLEGGYAKIAGELGVSREWVRKIATKAGFKIGPRSTTALIKALLNRTTITSHEIRRIAYLIRVPEKNVLAAVARMGKRRVSKVDPVTGKARFSVLGERQNDIRRELFRVFKSNGGKFPRGVGKELAEQLGVNVNHISQVKKKMIAEGFFPKKKK